MKRTLLLTAAMFCLLGCSFPTADEEEEGNTLPDPEITVTGIPDGPVDSWSSFTLYVSSKSESPLSFKVDKPETASVRLSKKRVYAISTAAPSEDTEVTITFSQEEALGFAASSVDVKFTVKKVEHTEIIIPGEPTEDLPGTKTVYTEVSGNVVNPERGFYTTADDIRKVSSPVTASKVQAVKAKGMSLLYVGFYLTDFLDGDISQAFLDMIQSSFDAMRDGGIKCILRFAYQNSESASPWDASQEVVLRHIEQLKPLLQKNEDVIFVLQAGFVGVWGEWYYTSNFGMDPSKYEDYLPRKAVCDALLDALPASRQIALRTPAFKMNMYQLSLADTLTSATAHDGSVKSRLCGHNDCFGASSSDYGTFKSSTDRNFWKADTRYTLMGGETCGISEYCTCDASLQDMQDYHWTYLNSDYHGSVISRWKSTGCHDEITSRLGYRLVMKDSFYEGEAAAGNTLKVTVRLCNKGFAAPQNPRIARLVFTDASGNRTDFPMPCDARDWQPGWYSIPTSITLPAAHGTVWLELADPLLQDRPEYSMALANEGVFDSSTGLNKLFEL